MKKKIQKNDAEVQLKLMKRKVITNTKMEEENDGGLVILIAKYGCNSNVNEWLDGFDVTFPLQFGVSDSRLLLTSYSKSQMLGFSIVQGISKLIASTSTDHVVSDESKSLSKWTHCLLYGTLCFTSVVVIIKIMMMKKNASTTKSSYC